MNTADPRVNHSSFSQTRDHKLSLAVTWPFLPIFLLMAFLFAGCGTGTETSPDLTGTEGPPLATDTAVPTATFTPTPTATVPTPTPTATPQPPRLRVEGTGFVDENGEEVILRGVAIVDPLRLSSDCCPQLGPWHEDLFKEISDWGATVVRIPIHPPGFYETGIEESLAVMDQAIEWAGKHGLYVIIDYHGLGFPPDSFDRFYWAATTEEEMFQFWDIVSERYAGNNTVAFYQPYNEPSRDNRRRLILEDWLLWKELSEATIDVIRENDPDTIVIISGMKGGNDISFALTAPIERDNIAYEAHPFPGVSRWLPWDRGFGRVTEVYPVIVEFGFDNDQQEDEFLWESTHAGPALYRDEIMAYIEERDLSWTIWVFSHDWTPRMLLDQNYTPSELGQFVKEQMQLYNADS